MVRHYRNLSYSDVYGFCHIQTVCVCVFSPPQSGTMCSKLGLILSRVINRNRSLSVKSKYEISSVI